MFSLTVRNNELCIVMEKNSNGNRSKRHHYLPVFYLKGFADGNGFLNMYDKKERKFFKSVPENVFLEKDRNTVLVGDTKIDGLEKVLSAMDGKFSNPISKLQRDISFNEDDWINLMVFISFQRFRIPSMDDFINNELTKMDFEELKYNIYADGKPLEGEMKEVIRSWKEFGKLNSTAAPFVPFYDEEGMQATFDRFRIINTQHGKRLIGDNPIIFKDSDIHSLNDFILPLTHSKIGVHSKLKEIQFFPPQCCMLLDMQILKQANRYVCCSDEMYLKELIRAYETAQYVGFEENETTKTLLEFLFQAN